MADGYLTFDTKMNPAGFQAGMDDLAAAAKTGMGEVGKAFEGSFSGDKLGASFQQFMSDSELAAEKVAESTKKIAKEVDQKVVPAMTKWHGLTSGIGRIVATMVPGFYKVNRAASGVSEVTKSIAVSGSAMSKVLTGAAIGAAVLVVIAAALVAAFTGLYKKMLQMDGFKDKAKGLQLAFANLKNAAMSAFMPLFNALLPIIMKVVAWLTEAANAVGAFIAALTGADTYMVYVADSVGSAAGSASDLADETERAGEAAEGALASFDKLNVLQQNEPSTSGGGGGGAGGTGHWEERPIPADNWWSRFKKDWAEFWNWSWDADAWFKAAIIDPLLASKFWNWKWDADAWFKKAVTDPFLKSKFWNWKWDADKWFKDSVWTPFINGAFWTWKFDANKWFLDSVWTPFITGTFWNWKWDANAWFKAAVTDPFLNSEFWNWSFDANKWFTDHVISPILNSTVWNWSWDANAWFKTAITDKIFNSDVWNWSFDANQWFKDSLTEPILNSDVWAWKFDANKWFADSLTNPVKNSDIWNWSFDANTWFVDSLLNPIIGGLEALINGIIDSINEWLPSGLNIPSVSLPTVFTPGEPDPTVWDHGATGMVIPPNAPFRAVYGDQRSGKNLESPESLMRQIVREETAGMGAQGNQAITINFAGSLGALMRELKPYADRENVRVGNSLVSRSSG